jgi:hypothetical protein
LGKGCPVVTEIDTIRKLFKDVTIEMQTGSDSSYVRSIPGGGKTELETVFGNPSLKTVN